MYIHNALDGAGEGVTSHPLCPHPLCSAQHSALKRACPPPAHLLNLPPLALHCTHPQHSRWQLPQQYCNKRCVCVAEQQTLRVCCRATNAACVLQSNTHCKHTAAHGYMYSQTLFTRHLLHTLADGSRNSSPTSSMSHVPHMNEACPIYA